MISKRELDIKKFTLEHGDTIEVCWCDAAGPNSKINLNSTAIFVRQPNKDWFKVESTKSFKTASYWINDCKDWSDVVQTLWIDLQKPYGE